MDKNRVMNGLFNRGAQNGLFVGLYLTLLSWVLILAIDSSLMNIVALLMLVCIPLGCFIMLRRSYIQENCTTPLSGLWLEGIVTFICGSMIYALVAYCYLRWGNPSFIPEQVCQAIEVYEKIDDDQAREIVSVLQQIEKHKAYPTAQQIVVQFGLLITFVGSILSLLTASFLKFQRKR